MRTAKNDSFRHSYDPKGKYIRFQDRHALVDKHVMFFVASNRWKTEAGDDYYGTFTDFMRWYNKRNHVERFLGLVDEPSYVRKPTQRPSGFTYDQE